MRAWLCRRGWHRWSHDLLRAWWTCPCGEMFTWEETYR